MRSLLLPPLVLLSAGCLDWRTPGPGEPMADFGLDDVNPTSATFARTVGVEEYRGVATAWYFTHST